MEQLRSLFNGTKWKGNTLKYADYCSHVTNRIECAKPSYLELIKEEKEKVNVEVADSTKKEESVARLDPPSGIPNTLLIRKSKRKFFVASINPVYKDEDGNVIAMETESSTNEAHDSSLPENVSIPSTSSDSHVVSTKKCAFPISLTPRHRFIQPEVLCFDLSPVEGTRSNLWDPIPSPKRRRVQTAVPTEEFVKSSIRLDDSSDDSQHEEFLRELEEGNQGNQGNQGKERGVISFESEDEDDGEEKEKQRGYVSFDSDEDEDEDNKEENEKKGIEKGIVSFESENEESENENENESESSHHSNESENDNENEKEVESNHNEIINNETHSETHPSSSESKVSTLPAALLASLENYEEDDLPAPDWYTEEQNSEGNQQEKRENAAQASCCEIDEKQAQKRSKSEEEPKKDEKGGIPENKVICRSHRKRGKESKAGEEE